MNRLKFTINIPASKTKIWEVLWNEDAYRDWSSVFAEGSHAVTNNWEEGSIVFFLGADKSGIYSKIETHIPNETITFRHIGNVLNAKKQPLNDNSKTWSGASETYSITEGENFNTLCIDIDIMDEHLEFMESILPKALERIKHNCK